MRRRFQIVVAVNDDHVFKRNLSASSLVSKQTVPVHVEKDAESASRAYNRGLDATSAPIIVFAHQDVYFPPSWLGQLNTAIERVEAIDPNWAVLAPTGISQDGRHVGTVWSSSLSSCIGEPVDTPVSAQSFDELTIVLNRKSGIRFDEELPNFHLYGTDVVQTALAANLGAWICQLPLVHNDKFHARLGEDFAQSYKFMRKKWRSRLPIQTTVIELSPYAHTLQLHRFKSWKSVKRRRSLTSPKNADPRIFSRMCGWEGDTNDPEWGVDDPELVGRNFRTGKRYVAK